MLSFNLVKQGVNRCLILMLTTSLCTPSSGQTTQTLRPRTTDVPSANATAVGDVSAFIIRGNVTDPHEYPFMAIVKRDNDFWCGGTLYTAMTVITAKHCVAGFRVSSLRVILGQHLRHALDGTEQVVTVREVKLHPNANIALLILSHAPDLNSAVAVLGEHQLVETVPAIGQSVTAVGWGFVGSTQLSTVLRHLKLTLVGNLICDIMGLNPASHEVCAGRLSGVNYANVCYGDQGGPLLMSEAGADSWKLLGVIQKGNPQCLEMENDFAIFTSIPALRPWILENEGNDVDPHGYPFMASVQRYSRFICSGTLYTASTVITARSCVGSSPASSLTVKLGDHFRYEIEGTEQVIAVREVKLHPSENIALLILNSAPRLNSAVAVLGEHQLVETVPDIGQPVTAVGWGSVGGTQDSSVLRDLDLTLVGNTICDIMRLNPTAQDICAGRLSGVDFNVCFGDRGGPLLMREAEGAPWKLLGVIHGDNVQCGETENKFATFTSIPSVRQWILDNHGCFPGSALVQTPFGSKKMSDLKVGDLVLTVQPEGTAEYSPVLSFLHREPAKSAHFLTLSTEKSGHITLSPKHLVFKACEESGKLTVGTAVFASMIRAGDNVLVSSSAGVKVARVNSVSDSMDTGVYAPLTSSGNIVVGNVVASCYASFENHEVAHLTFAPLRWYLAIMNWWERTSIEQQEYCENDQCILTSEVDLNGIHWYPRLLMSIFPSLY